MVISEGLFYLLSLTFVYSDELHHHYDKGYRIF